MVLTPSVAFSIKCREKVTFYWGGGKRQKQKTQFITIAIMKKWRVVVENSKVGLILKNMTSILLLETVNMSTMQNTKQCFELC